MIRHFAVRVPDHGRHATITLELHEDADLAPALFVTEDKAPIDVESLPRVDAADRWKVYHPGGHELLVILWPGLVPHVQLADGVSSWSWLDVRDADEAGAA